MRSWLLIFLPYDYTFAKFVFVAGKYSNTKTATNHTKTALNRFFGFRLCTHQKPQKPAINPLIRFSAHIAAPRLFKPRKIREKTGKPENPAQTANRRRARKPAPEPAHGENRRTIENRSKSNEPAHGQTRAQSAQTAHGQTAPPKPRTIPRRTVNPHQYPPRKPARRTAPHGLPARHPLRICTGITPRPIGTGKPPTANR